jgi:hypothetical protein
MKKRWLLILVSFCLQTYGASTQPTGRTGPEQTTTPALSAEAAAYLPLIEGLKKGLSNQTALMQFKLLVTTLIHESQLNEQKKATALKLLSILEEGLAIDWKAVQAAEKEFWAISKETAPAKRAQEAAQEKELTAQIEGLEKTIDIQTLDNLTNTKKVNEWVASGKKDITLNLAAVKKYNDLLDKRMDLWKSDYPTVPHQTSKEQPAIMKKAKDWQNKVGPIMMTLFQAALTTLDQAQLTSALSFIVKTFIETLQAPLPGVLPSSQTNLPNKHGV